MEQARHPKQKNNAADVEVSRRKFITKAIAGATAATVLSAGEAAERTRLPLFANKQPARHRRI